jgi:hypothetical protein
MPSCVLDAFSGEIRHNRQTDADIAEAARIPRTRWIAHGGSLGEQVCREEIMVEMAG